MLPSTPSLIAMTPVLVDRADDFQRWLGTVVVPAARSHHAEVEGRWGVLRSAVAQDGVVHFLFLFTGDDPSLWQLHPLLEQTYGAAGAARELAAMGEMLSGAQSEWPVAEVAFA